MTWPPKQDPCTPDCTCTALGAGEPWTPLDRAMRWPDVPTEPVTRQWIEDTDPAPVAEPPKPLPPVPEHCYPPGAVDLPIRYDRPSIIRRVLNATRRNT